MSYTRWYTNEDIPLHFVISDGVGNPAISASVTPEVTIRRTSDNQYWDGNSFTASPVWLSMSYYDSGVFRYLFSQSLIASASVTYGVYFRNTGSYSGFEYEFHTITAPVSIDVTSIVSGVWNALTSGFTVDNSFGSRIGLQIPTTSSLAELSEISASVWNASRDNHIATGTFGQSLQFTSSFIDVGISTRSSGAVGLLPSDLAAISSSVWNALRISHNAAGTMGERVSDIGVPSALDGGTPTIAGMLQKMAGTGFVESTDALHNLATTIVTANPTALTATGSVVINGTIISGSYLSTYNIDSSHYEISPSAVSLSGFGLDVYLQFDLTSSQSVNNVTIRGYFDASGSGRYCDVFAYNWGDSAWDQLSDAGTRMNDSSVPGDFLYTLLSSHQNVSGSVNIGFKSPSTTTTDILHLDQVLVNVVTEGPTAAEIADAVYSRLRYTVYDGYIYIDTISGVAGTVLGVNGLPNNPVNNWTDAKVLAAALGVNHFRINSDSDFTLDSDISADYIFDGRAAIHLGGQNISDALFRWIDVDGVSSGDDAHFINCQFRSTSSLGTCHVVDSVFNGKIICNGTGDYLFERCLSGLTSPETPEFQFNSGVSAGFRGYSGGLKIYGMTATEKLSIDGWGHLIIGPDCTGGTITIRGPFVKTDLVPGGFVGTIEDASRWAEDQNVYAVTNPSSISASIWNAERSDHVGSSVFGNSLQFTSSFVDASISSRATPNDILADGTKISGSYIDVAISTRSSGSTELLASDLAAISASVWNAKRYDHYILGTFGETLQFSGSFIDVAISTRSSGAVGLLPSDLAAISASVWNALTSSHNIPGTFGFIVQLSSSTLLEVYDTIPL